MSLGGISIDTDRLVLRPWNAADAETLLELRTDPDIIKWLGSPEPWRDLDHARNEIGIWNRRNDADDPLGTWAITTPNSPAPLGSVNLSPIRLGNEIEVGWYLHPDAVGNGYATEAARAVIDHGLTNGVRRIWALMWRTNSASAKVAKAAGMRDLGVLVDPWYGSEDDPYSQMFLAYES